MLVAEYMAANGGAYNMIHKLKNQSRMSFKFGSYRHVFAKSLKYSSNDVSEANKSSNLCVYAPLTYIKQIRYSVCPQYTAANLMTSITNFNKQINSLHIYLLYWVIYYIPNFISTTKIAKYL